MFGHVGRPKIVIQIDGQTHEKWHERFIFIAWRVGEFFLYTHGKLSRMHTIENVNETQKERKSRKYKRQEIGIALLVRHNFRRFICWQGKTIKKLNKIVWPKK